MKYKIISLYMYLKKIFSNLEYSLKFLNELQPFLIPALLDQCFLEERIKILQSGKS